MRNSDEFRRLVYEKAEAYDKRRKARNRKIMSSAVICSLVLALCLPVGIHVYYLHGDVAVTDTSTFATMAAETTLPDLTTTAMTYLTTTTAYTMTTTTAGTSTTKSDGTVNSVNTDGSATETIPETTTYEETMTANTTTAALETTTMVETTKPLETTTMAETTADGPTNGAYESVGSCSYEVFIEYFHGNRVIQHNIEGETALEDFLTEHQALYGEEIMETMTRYDEEYFTKYELVIVQSCHRVHYVLQSEGKITVKLRESMSATGNLYLFTVEKGTDFVLDSVW